MAIAGEVLNVNARRRGRLHDRRPRASRTGRRPIGATWFNQPWLADQLKPGVRVRLRGKPGRYGFDVTLVTTSATASATADFAPVYPASEEISPKKLRALVAAALPHAARLLGSAARPSCACARALPLKSDALVAVHRPEPSGEAETRPAAARLRGAARCSRSASRAARPSASGRSRRRSASRAS